MTTVYQSVIGLLMLLQVEYHAGHLHTHEEEPGFWGTLAAAVEAVA